MKKVFVISIKWAYRMAVAFCVIGFFVLLLVPTHQDMITMIKNDSPAWHLRVSQLWGNDPLQVDKEFHGRTSLQWAAATTSYPSVISFLTHAGNDINQSSDGCKATPLQFALEKNQNLEVIERLLDLGADPNLILSDGRTAFLVASCVAKNTSILEVLRHYNADINAVDTSNQADALHWAADHNNNLEIIQYLVSIGFDVNSLDGMQRTPLMKVATRNQNPEIMQFLIDKGAVLDNQDKNWETALIRGCKESKNPKVLQVLLDAGADVNLTNNQQKRAIDYAWKNRALQDSEFLKKLERLSQ